MSTDRYLEYPNSLACYVVVNAHLSEAQKAVQSCHAIAEMFKDSTMTFSIPGSNDNKVVSFTNWYPYLWTKNGKTIILLETGKGEPIAELNYLKNMFIDMDVKSQIRFPVGHFVESESSNGGIITALSTILPNYVVKAARHPDGILSFDREKLTPKEASMIERIAKFSLSS